MRNPLAADTEAALKKTLAAVEGESREARPSTNTYINSMSITASINSTATECNTTGVCVGYDSDHDEMENRDGEHPPTAVATVQRLVIDYLERLYVSIYKTY